MMKIPHSCNYCIYFFYNNYPYCEAKEEKLDCYTDRKIQAVRKCEEFKGTDISWLTGKSIEEKRSTEIPEYLLL